MMAEFLTAAEAAALAGVSRARIYSAVADGSLQPAEGIISGIRVFRAEDVQAWAARPKSVGGRPRKNVKTAQVGETS